MNNHIHFQFLAKNININVINTLIMILQINHYQSEN